jgi:hypothetical protein
MIEKRVDRVLELEARCFARYLLGRELEGHPLEQAFVERYARALAALAEEPGQADPVLEMARRAPWLLPFLDAGAALFARQTPLRRRLLIMTAILEASPDFVGHFMIEEATLGSVSKALLSAGIRTALTAPIGGLLLVLAGTRRER